MNVKSYCSSNADIEEIIQFDSGLASFPDVYYEFRRVIKKPDLDFDELERVILKDTNLTAHLLKIVNSAFYSFSSKIETISHATSIIGTEQLGYLVLSTVVMDKFKGIPQDVININSFWRHSIACGMVSKKLAEYKGEMNTERHFIFGLLHDVGRLVMCLKMPNRNWEILVRSDTECKPVHLVEMEELGFDHAQLGGVLLKKWNLPLIYQDVVKHHHNPNEASSFPYEAANCHLADIIANTLELGCSGESKIVPRLEEQAWIKACPPKDINMEIIRDEIEESFDETASAFLSH